MHSYFSHCFLCTYTSFDDLASADVTVDDGVVDAWFGCFLSFSIVWTLKAFVVKF